VALDRRGSASPFWHSDNNGSPAWQFIVRYFPQELQVEAQSHAFLTCGVIEKVHDVSSKPILEPSAFIEVERAYRIHFDIQTFAQGRTQVALESEGPLPYLRHGERNNAIRHRLKSGLRGGRGRPLLHQETKHSRLAGLRTAND
jgi:hypothetical protein